MPTKTKSARASVKYVRVTPNKVRFVLDMIRGKHVDEAKRILLFTPKAAAPYLVKILDSAVANAGTVLNAEPQTLFVSECWADEGPMLKRFMPRAQGRAYQILKRTSHITVVVEQMEGSRGPEN